MARWNDLLPHCAASAAQATLVLGLSVAPAAGVNAQELRGTLREQTTGRPLSQGRVELLDSAGEVVAQATADDEGLFLLSVGVAGTYQVRGSRINAETVTDGPLELAPGQVLELDFLLPVDAFELEALDVTVSGTQLLRDVGFYDRSRSSSGAFLDRSDIEGGLFQTTTDVLGRVPGVQIDYVINPINPTVLLRGGARHSAARPGGGTLAIPQCYPVVYLDGLRVQEGGAIGEQVDNSAATLMDQRDLFNYGQIPPEQIEGIEVYGRIAQVPVQYMTVSAGCGVIVIWTRPPGRVDGR